VNWLVFAFGAWLMLGLELGLKTTLRLGDTGIAPSFVAVLAVYVASAAPARAAQWACLILGALMDLTAPVSRVDAASTFTVLGPNALGALLMCQFVLASRGLLFRRNPLTLAVLTGVGFALWQIVFTAVFSVRNLLGDPIVWSATGQLVTRLGSSVYTGVAALPIALLLLLFGPLFGFQSVPHRFTTKR
jgi:cell shape-determining protein MreD